MKAYNVSEWHGMPLYNCTACGYDTLDETEMLRHEATHQPPPQPQPKPVRVLDRFANVVADVAAETNVVADVAAETNVVADTLSLIAKKAKKEE